MIENIIIGRNGFIAQKFKDIERYHFTSSNIEDHTSTYLDLRFPCNFDYSIINENSNIIFLAAISSPDECKNNFKYSYDINVTGTKYFITEALRKGAKVLFFSSDVVYGNTLEKVDENSPTNPFGSYAKMKDEVEKIFANEKKFKVFRLSYILSKDDKYLSYLKNCADKGETADVFHPFSRKVIYIDDIFEAIENILIRWNEFDNQKFNICGEHYVSRKDIADLYNETIGHNLKYNILKPDDNFWKARPKNINIGSLYFDELLGRKPTEIKDAINIITSGDK